MTLIAGFLCPDGFVIAGDTEITYGDIRIQETKLLGAGGDASYSLVLGGAGDVAYMDEAIQEIRSSVLALGSVKINSVDAIIRKTIARIYERNIFRHWEPGDNERPSIELVIGCRDDDEQVALWKTADKTVSRVGASVFAGSGAILASHVGEKLFRYGASTPIVHHIATQIVRESKRKSSGVGGNTDTWSVKTARAGPYFELPEMDGAYLWRLEDVLLSAVRCALSDRAEAVQRRTAFIINQLEALRASTATVIGQVGKAEWHMMEIGRKDLHPFNDL